MSALKEISNLRQRMALETPVDVPDGAGGFSRQWQTVADIWAAIESMAPRSGFEAEQQDYSASHRITIRWRPDVSAGMRLNVVGGNYYINGAFDADGQRAFMTCYCEGVLT